MFYVRSSSGDKKLIQSQIDELTKEYGEPSHVYQDNASGLNENRRALQKLFNDAEKEKFDTVCATYSDRLTRFGFSYIERFLKTQNVTIQILHGSEKYSETQELMKDFMSLHLSQVLAENSIACEGNTNKSNY